MSIFDNSEVKDVVNQNITTTHHYDIANNTDTDNNGAASVNMNNDYIKSISANLLNTNDDNTNEYIFTRDATGTVVGVVSTLKVPRNEIVHVETRHAITGVVFHRELRFKKDVEKYFTSSWIPHPDFPRAHRDEDENTTTHYTILE